MKAPRKVYPRMNEAGTAWHILYVERRPGQHHKAAALPAEYSLTQCEEWIAKQPELELSAAPGELSPKTTKDYFEASLNPASENYVPLGTYEDER